MPLPRSTSFDLGSLSIEVSIGSDHVLERKASEPGNIDVLLSVSTVSKPLNRCGSSCSSLDSIDEADASSQRKHEYLRFHSSVPRRFLLVVLLLLNLSFAACASFVNLPKTLLQGSSSLTATIHKASLYPGSAVDFTWRSGSSDAGPKLRPYVPYVARLPSVPLPGVQHATELARSVQQAASTELEKLLVQLGPCHRDPKHAPSLRRKLQDVPVPNHIVASVAILSTATTILSTPDEKILAQAEAKTHIQALEEAAALLGEPENRMPPVRVRPDPPAAKPTILEAAVSSSPTPAADLPAGFDIDVAVETADLCGLAYHSCDPKDKQGRPTHVPRLLADLNARGMEMVAEVQSAKHDTYALISRSEDTLHITFRGSSSLKNALVDINYLPADDKTLAAYGKEAGLQTPRGLQVHAGFLEAWRSLREGVMAQVDAIAAEESTQLTSSRPLKLVLSGHSMGGALAMLASLELRSRFKKQKTSSFSGGHLTYTFAAPRVGNAKFARVYNRAFPKVTDHWALQRSNDAVPHLPFAAWGFRHPKGVAFMNVDAHSGHLVDEQECASEEAPPVHPPRAAEKPLEAIERSGDRGDDYVKLRPFGNKMHNWATYHHIMAYLEPLQSLRRPAEYVGYEA
jgi:hypothetical protein